MKIPEKIKIGGHWYKVEFPYVFKERFDRYAQVDDAIKVIRLTDRDNSGSQRAESGVIVSFIHEVLHGIDYVTGHRIFDGHEGERKVEALSEGIFQVLVDNGYLTIED